MFSCLSFLNCIIFFHLNILIQMPHQTIFFVFCGAPIGKYFVAVPHQFKIYWLFHQTPKRWRETQRNTNKHILSFWPVWTAQDRCGPSIHTVCIFNQMHPPLISHQSWLMRNFWCAWCCTWASGRCWTSQRPCGSIHIWWIYHVIVK